MLLHSKDLLGMQQVTPQEITAILNQAVVLHQILDSNSKKTPHLQGKSIITLFYENSTRTRMSFELACKYMSAAAANISASTSSVQKGETLLDTGRTLDVMGADVIIMRHPNSGAPHMLAKHIQASVVNAGDGMNEHPTQALLDMYTMRRHKGDLAGLEVAILGDIAHSRVARSNIWGLAKMGAKVRVYGPKTLLPDQLEQLPVTVCRGRHEAAEGADVVMSLRLQLERQRHGLFPTLDEYAKHYGIDASVVACARPDALVMHPGPINRGVELTTEMADCAQSVIDEQVTSGVAVRMAILYLLTRRKDA